MRTDFLDKIVLENPEKDLKDLLDWRDRNKEKVRDFKIVLEEGIIELGNIKVYFKAKGKNEVYIKNIVNDEVIVEFLINTGENTYKLLNFNKDYKSIKEGDLLGEDGLCQNIITLYASLMAYICDDEKNVIVEVKKESKKSYKGKGKKSKKKRRKNTVKIVKTLKVNTDNLLKDRENKREYTRKTEGWTVRGHWRKLKSGKKVWVRPYKKGGVVEGKVYKV